MARLVGWTLADNLGATSKLGQALNSVLYSLLRAGPEREQVAERTWDEPVPMN